VAPALATEASSDLFSQQLPLLLLLIMLSLQKYLLLYPASSFHCCRCCSCSYSC
jgi:hypothetical protein